MRKRHPHLRLASARTDASAHPARPPKLTLDDIWKLVDHAESALRAGEAVDVDALVGALLGRPLRTYLAVANEVFEAGAEEPELLDAWIYAAVRVRSVLERAARVASELRPRLVALDAELAADRGAVLLLSREDYEEALAGVAPRVGAWWGEPRRLDAVPEAAMERLLRRD